MNILLIDIETSPHLAWTFETRRAWIGHNAIVQESRPICFAAKLLGDKKTLFFAEWLQGYEGMMQAAFNLLSTADIVVHFNGQKFDERRLNQEFAKLGLGKPEPYQRIDLWRVVHDNFGLASEKLDYVCKYFGVKAKISTGGIGLWIAERNGEEWARDKFRKYNVNDVEIMEPLYHKLLPWIKHPNVNLFSNSGGPADESGYCCPGCGSDDVQKRGYHRTKVSAYQRYRCNNCLSWSFDGTKRVKGSALRGAA